MAYLDIDSAEWVQDLNAMEAVGIVVGDVLEVEHIDLPLYRDFASDFDYLDCYPKIGSNYYFSTNPEITAVIKEVIIYNIHSNLMAVVPIAKVADQVVPN